MSAVTPTTQSMLSSLATEPLLYERGYANDSVGVERGYANEPTA